MINLLTKSLDKGKAGVAANAITIYAATWFLLNNELFILF
jgi:hypothetical protein